MKKSIETFVGVREATGQLLSSLGLKNYRFDVEPMQHEWEVRLEYESREGWTESKLRVDESVLETAARDELVREQLLTRWRDQLAAIP